VVSVDRLVLEETPECCWSGVMPNQRDQSTGGICCIVLYNNISHSSYLEQYIALYAAAMLCSGSLLVYQARVYMN